MERLGRKKSSVVRIGEDRAIRMIAVRREHHHSTTWPQQSAPLLDDRQWLRHVLDEVLGDNAAHYRRLER